MAAIAADHNLLFGLLALQNGLIDQVQLVAAFQAWTRDKARPLADHLVGRGDLDAEQRGLLEALVAQHLKKHGGDAEKSLAAVAGRRVDPRRAWSRPRRPGDRRHARPRRRSAGAATRTRPRAHAEPTPSVRPPPTGSRFRILRPHAQGGLGQVSVALDAELNREVALKEIRPEHADDPDSRARFLLEAEITGRLEHPGVVPVYGLGCDAQGRPFYAMRLVKGESLKEAIERFHAGRSDAHGRDPRRWNLALRQLLNRFVAVCNAMAYAHSRGVIHRDLKPANILLGPYGETLVVDWGLAKVVGRGEAAAQAGAVEATLQPASGSGSSETLPGTALGTPAYMSPEQAEGRLEQVGPLSDVYSLGATLYCLLTGKPPIDETRRRRGAAPGAARGVPAAACRAARRPAGPGGDLPEGDGAAARGPLRLGAGAGRGHRALAGRRADHRGTGPGAHAPDAVGTSAQDRGGGDRRAADHGGRRAGDQHRADRLRAGPDAPAVPPGRREPGGRHAGAPAGRRQGS